MDTKSLVLSAKPRMVDIAAQIVAGRQTEALSAFGALVRGLPAGADRRMPQLLAGLIVTSVAAQQSPRSKFEDPLTAFEDPLTAFEDPLTAFEDPLTAFGDPAMQKLALALLVAPR
jgi:hypothetical protein